MTRTSRYSCLLEGEIYASIEEWRLQVVYYQSDSAVFVVVKVHLNLLQFRHTALNQAVVLPGLLIRMQLTPSR